MQDFSKSWTDEELYAKYNLNTEEIAFIEKMVRPMPVDDDAAVGQDAVRNDGTAFVNCINLAGS